MCAYASGETGTHLNHSIESVVAGAASSRGRRSLVVKLLVGFDPIEYTIIRQGISKIREYMRFRQTKDYDSKSTLKDASVQPRSTRCCRASRIVVAHIETSAGERLGGGRKDTSVAQVRSFSLSRFAACRQFRHARQAQHCLVPSRVYRALLPESPEYANVAERSVPCQAGHGSWACAWVEVLDER